MGSPTLAAYSLAITVVDSHWTFRKFMTIKYPNRKHAAIILTSLQQLPLTINSGEKGGLVASLIVLPENDKWWAEMVEGLDYSFTWSIANASSIAWVTIAFIFTVIDSFAKLGQDISDSVQSVGLIWLWLLPIVVGWLLYPVCARSKLVYTLKQANKSAYVADSVSDPVLASSRKSELQAISVSPRSGAVYRDEKKFADIQLRTFLGLDGCGWRGG